MILDLAVRIHRKLKVYISITNLSEVVDHSGLCMLRIGAVRMQLVVVHDHSLMSDLSCIFP